MNTKKTTPSWSDVKTSLTNVDRAGLLGLLQALYAANKDNQTFLHVRLNLGDDVLKPYKTTIDRWLWPDMFKNQDISVAKAKKPIADYKKALGQPECLAELMVFYCERAAGFTNDVGLEDDDYFDALVRMFEQALKTIAGLAEAQRLSLWERLRSVYQACQNFGYGVSDEMCNLLDEYGAHD